MTHAEKRQTYLDTIARLQALIDAEPDAIRRSVYARQRDLEKSLLAWLDKTEAKRGRK